MNSSKIVLNSKISWQKYSCQTDTIYWEMQTNALRILVNNPFKEIFYEKRKKNILTVFFIFHKNYVKIFLK